MEINVFPQKWDGVWSEYDLHADAFRFQVRLTIPRYNIRGANSKERDAKVEAIVENLENFIKTYIADKL